MDRRILLLGVDGGGTKCRARLADWAGRTLGSAIAGPANLRFGAEESFAAIFKATRECLAEAGLPWHACDRIVACLALAGAGEVGERDATPLYPHPFSRAFVVADAHAACIGAHEGRDGGVMIAGTGTIGWAFVGGRSFRCGGWGFPVSDEGSGAWLGAEAIRHTLKAYDGRDPWTPLLHAIFTHFRTDPRAIVDWLTTAKPRDFGAMAPLVVAAASRHDPVAAELLQAAAIHIDGIAHRLVALGTPVLALMGGLAPYLEPRLAAATRKRLVPAAEDAVSGALRIARRAAEELYPERIKASFG